VVSIQAGNFTPHCPGDGKADPGYLCLYDHQNGNAQLILAHSSEAPWGASLFWAINGPSGYVAGEYTVTAQ
jgi:hypothetical protein